MSLLVVLKLGMRRPPCLSQKNFKMDPISFQWNDLVAVGVLLPPSIAREERTVVMAVLKRVFVCSYGMDCA